MVLGEDEGGSLLVDERRPLLQIQYIGRVWRTCGAFWLAVRVVGHDLDDGGQVG